MRDWVDLDVLHSARFAKAAPARGVLRVVAWNIQRGSNLERWAQLFADADVVLISEADVGMARSANLDVPARLAELLGMHYAFAPAFRELTLGTRYERLRFHGGKNQTALHGNAILSRVPLHDVRRVILPDQFAWSDAYERRNGARVALLASLALPQGLVTVCCAHLEIHAEPQGRAEQFQHLLDHVPPGPTLIGGDFNTLGRRPLLQNIPGFLLERLGGSRASAPAEPLFAVAERAGFHWNAGNTWGGTWAPLPAIPARLRPRLDWIFARELTVAAPKILPAPLVMDGRWITRLSDHDGIQVDLVGMG